MRRRLQHAAPTRPCPSRGHAHLASPLWCAGNPNERSNLERLWEPEGGPVAPPKPAKPEGENYEYYSSEEYEENEPNEEHHHAHRHHHGGDHDTNKSALIAGLLQQAIDHRLAVLRSYGEDPDLLPRLQAEAEEAARAPKMLAKTGNIFASSGALLTAAAASASGDEGPYEYYYEGEAPAAAPADGEYEYYDEAPAAAKPADEYYEDAELTAAKPKPTDDGEYEYYEEEPAAAAKPAADGDYQYYDEAGGGGGGGGPAATTAVAAARPAGDDEGNEYYDETPPKGKDGAGEGSGGDGHAYEYYSGDSPPATATGEGAAPNAEEGDGDDDYYEEEEEEEGAAAAAPPAGTAPPTSLPTLWSVAGTPEAGEAARPEPEVEAALLRQLHEDEQPPIDAGEQAVLVKHLNSALDGDDVLSGGGGGGGGGGGARGSVLPISPSGDALFVAITQSLVLPKFIGLTNPEVLDVRAIALPSKGGALSPAERRRNHSLALGAAAALGCVAASQTAEQLDDATRHAQPCLRLLWALVRHALLSRLSPRANPDLAGLLHGGELAPRAPLPPPECLVLRWLRLQLRLCAAAGSPHIDVCARRVSNLSSDVADGQVLAVVSQHVALRPAGMASDHSLVGALAAGPDARAVVAKMLSDATAAGANLVELTPADLAKPRMALAFVAALVNLFPSLPAAAPLPAPTTAEMGDEREETALRTWMLSLHGWPHATMPLRNLFVDCVDALPLLHTIDAMQPGRVAWGRVSTDRAALASSAALRRANCAYACEAIRDLVVGELKLIKELGGSINADDLAEGRRPAVLNAAWHLMRASLLRKLPPALANERSVTAWANARVEASGSELSIGGPKAAAVREGRFLLQLLSVVAPEAVRLAEVQPGRAPPEAQSNASYAISCARASGCAVFAHWRDLAETRPKMVMSVLFALQALDAERGGGAPTPPPTPPAQPEPAQPSLKATRGRPSLSRLSSLLPKGFGANKRDHQ